MTFSSWGFEPGSGPDNGMSVVFCFVKRKKGDPAVQLSQELFLRLTVGVSNSLYTEGGLPGTHTSSYPPKTPPVDPHPYAPLGRYLEMRVPGSDGEIFVGSTPPTKELFL